MVTLNNKCTVKYQVWPRNAKEFESYLLGLILGDGQVEEKRITITDSSRDFLIQIAKQIEQHLKLNPKIRKRKNVNAYTLRIYSKNYVNKVGKLVKNLTININFIRGFFDAEGTLYYYRKTPILEISTVNKELLLKISQELFKHEIVSHVKTHNYFHKYRRKTYTDYVLVIKRKDSVSKFLQTIGLRHPKHLRKIPNNSPTPL